MDYPTIHQTECNVTPTGPESSVRAAERQRRYDVGTADSGADCPVLSDMRQLILARRVSFSRALGDTSCTDVRIILS